LSLNAAFMLAEAAHLRSQNLSEVVEDILVYGDDLTTVSDGSSMAAEPKEKD
jgi:hypothetical protein